MVKKLATAVCLAGLFAGAFGGNNARMYALGQPWFPLDITLVAGQGWQTLHFADQVQGSFDYSVNQPGPVIVTKSLGQNFAVGLTFNTFDRVTKGSVLSSSEFFKEANLCSSVPMKQPKFPNLPQYHFGMKIGEHKIGLDAFFEEVDASNYQKDVAAGIEEKRLGKILNFGGQISGRIALGKAAINPWFKYGIPMVSHLFTHTEPGYEQKIAGGMDGANRMIVTGLCGDMDFGGLGWAIACFGFRNETFRFRNDTTTNSVTTGAAYPTRYDNTYLSYFATYTPKFLAFKDFTLAIEYQGQYHIKRYLHPSDSPAVARTAIDTIGKNAYNDVIICMEKTVSVNKAWCDKLVARGSLSFSLKRQYNSNDGSGVEYILPNGNIQRGAGEWLTNEGKPEGILPTLGIGYVVGRFTMDAAVNLAAWGNNGIINGPPLLAFTATVNLHK